MTKKMKLTPTTNDQLHGGNGAIPFQAFPMPVQVVYGQQPEPAPGALPAPPAVIEPPQVEKKKRGRKKKEQVAEIKPPPMVSFPQPKTIPLKIACIGTAPSSKMLAPFNDPTWKIWGCSPGNAMQLSLPRLDAWFEVHGKALLWPEDAHYAPQYIEWMKHLRCPVWLLPNHHTDPDKTPIVPNANIIPMDDLINEFGPYDFTSTFAWMMAMALHLGAKEIALYGIDMASKDEYIQQRAGAYAFFKEAARRGVRIFAPNESDIMQPPPLYGYSAVGPYNRKVLARIKELRERKVPLEQQFNSARDNINYIGGALEDSDYFNSILGGAQDNTSHIRYLNRLIEDARKARQEAAPPNLTLPSQG